MFNPNAQFQSLALADGRVCWIADDILQQPDTLVAFASERRQALREVDFNFYPGVYLPPPEPFTAQLRDFFNAQVRKRFDARRLLGMHCRLSMVTRAPAQLSPMQCLCHRDRPMLDPQHSIQACMLYLFHDAALGGTSFYRPRQSEEKTRQLFADAQQLPPDEFFSRHGLPRQYLGASNDWFEKIGTVPARWNRGLFFDGYGFHSGDIPAPGRLSSDPSSGRLTLNGFFTSRRPLH